MPKKSKPVKKIKPVDKALTKIGGSIDPAFYRKVMSDTEKKFALTAAGLEIPFRLSFGLLVYDLLSGGGMVPGTQVQVSGLEGAAKSTLCVHAFGQALKVKIPILDWRDPENAVNGKNIRNIIKREVAEIFQGPTRVAGYYPEQGLELFYNSVRNTMKNLPDKLWDAERKRWFFVFDSDQHGRQMMAAAGFKSPEGSKKKPYDQQKFQETGRLWVPCDNPYPQGFIIADSYPAFIPDDDDEKDDGSAAMALDARAFSKNIKRIAGRMKRKGFILLGVNQIRLRPGQTHVNPEYEPGGEALKFYSSLRFQQRKVAVPQGLPKGTADNGDQTTEFSTEKSVYGKTRTDNYVYINVRNTKNKFGTPFGRAKMRILFNDGRGRMMGFDPVWDTLEYLRRTGRATGTFNKGFKFNVPELDEKIKGFSKRTWTYMEFKLLILAEAFGESKLIERVEKELKCRPVVRKFLFAEVANPKRVDAIMEAVRDAQVEKEDDDDEDMED